MVFRPALSWVNFRAGFIGTGWNTVNGSVSTPREPDMPAPQHHACPVASRAQAAAKDVTRLLKTCVPPTGTGTVEMNSDGDA